MATDYEKYYSNNRHGLGEPTQEFVTFFNDYAGQSCDVLDIGCGQGRDALFIARLGHRVTAIDLSPTGIRDLKIDAKGESLAINAIVADIRHYEWNEKFNVIVIDRTLHMLSSEEQNKVLKDLLCITRAGSYILIADEPSNIPAFNSVFQASQWRWSTTLAQKGFLFMIRQ